MKMTTQLVVLKTNHTQNSLITFIKYHKQWNVVIRKEWDQSMIFGMTKPNSNPFVCEITLIFNRRIQFNIPVIWL